MGQYVLKLTQLFAGFAGLCWLLTEPAAYRWNAAVDQSEVVLTPAIGHLWARDSSGAWAAMAASLTTHQLLWYEL